MVKCSTWRPDHHTGPCACHTAAISISILASAREKTCPGLYEQNRICQKKIIKKNQTQKTPKYPHPVACKWRPTGGHWHVEHWLYPTKTWVWTLPPAKAVWPTLPSQTHKVKDNQKITLGTDVDVFPQTKTRIKPDVGSFTYKPGGFFSHCDARPLLPNFREINGKFWWCSPENPLLILKPVPSM